MSFSQLVKAELCTLKLAKQNLAASEVHAFLKMNSEVVISSKGVGIEFYSSSPGVARRFINVLKFTYDLKVDLKLLHINLPNKKTKFIVSIDKEQEKIKKIIENHRLLTSDFTSDKMFLRDIEERRAFLRAAFICGGSINDPYKNEYHLEISSQSENTILLVQNVANEANFDLKIAKRRKNLLVYSKDSTKIGDFLQEIGASSTLMSYENIRIEKDFRNSLNRLINIEIANEEKTIKTSLKQLEDIRIVEEFYNTDLIDEKIVEIIDLRKAYPDLTLTQLVFEYKKKYDREITKSGLNHRLIKISKLAKKALLKI